MRVRGYFLLTRLFGLSIGIHLMEQREALAIEAYKSLLPYVPDVASILEEEEVHEGEILALIEDDRLHYMGSVVLGLSDAIVEFTGTLAGLTLALQDSRLIALAGLITSVAAALSMGASEYLVRRTDPGSRIPRRAAAYTGISYIVTVLILVLPYLLIANPLLALPFTLSGALAVILLFTYYTSVAQDHPFGRRFLEMAAISMGVAGLSFVIGILIRSLLPVSV